MMTSFAAGNDDRTNSCLNGLFPDPNYHAFAGDICERLAGKRVDSIRAGMTMTASMAPSLPYATLRRNDGHRSVGNVRAARVERFYTDLPFRSR
jgi:hypothetical protein